MAFEGNRQINEWLAGWRDWTGARSPCLVGSSDASRQNAPLVGPRHRTPKRYSRQSPHTLDWDLWLALLAFRPYHPAYAPFRWRGWWDFGSGGLGDMGIHNLAPVFSALETRRSGKHYRSLHANLSGDRARRRHGALSIPASRQPPAGKAPLVRWRHAS